MNIAVWHNLPSGGGKRALYNHIKVLLSKGHYVEAWTTDMSSSDYLPLQDIISENRKPFQDKYLELWKIRNPIKREQKIIHLLNNHSKECVKEIEEKKFDLLFANSCSISYMPYIGKFTSIKKFVYLGEPYRPLYEAFPENIWKAPYHELRLKKVKRIYNDYRINYSRRIKVLNEIEAAKSYDRILVNSLFSREAVIRAYGLDAFVCYLGIDAGNFKSGIAKKEPYAVGVGTISFIKSIDKAIQIIGKIPERSRPSLKWIANGFEKSYLDEQIALAKSLKVDFEYFLNIPDSDLIDIIAKAAVMIYTPRLEPFGLAPLEANACGTYVVGIAEGGVKESIINGINGTLINGYNVQELADNIMYFTNNLEFALNKGIEAREHISKYWNMDSMAENLVNEINRV